MSQKMRFKTWKRRRIRNSRKTKQLVFETLEARQLLAVTVPEFSSLPGADHTIYLDFDGQVVEDTSWNSYYGQSWLAAPVYNIDGDATTFSPTELARIEESWNRIAEDFQPFQVNVTTVDPGVNALVKSGSGDSQWGVRVIMTNEAGMVTDPGQRTGAGGIAYINSFNWSTDTPVWVFTTGGKSIAEAASHEVGHSLGLSHDGQFSGGSYYTGHGSGETGWASIMGVGYYQNVSQWDSGEYYDSNNAGSGANYGNGPDDLAVIVGNNGFGYRADDHGNSDSVSTLLDLDGTTVTASGLIETTNDVDVFSFTTGAGLVTLNIDPFTPGPNLDIKAELYDGSGGLVATSNSTSVLDAGFSLNLAAGQYFVHIDGTGWGTPSASSPSGYSDYGSLGQYTLNGSIVDTGGLPTISISDTSAEENGELTFEVSLSKSSNESVTVNFQSVDSSAIGGSDYVTDSGTITFLTGEQSKFVTIELIDDALFENTETMILNLFAASGAVIVDSQGNGVILDDDPAPFPTVSISDASVNEGKQNTRGRNAGTSQLTDMFFTVTLSEASSQSVSVNYRTNDVTATVDDDYQFLEGTVTFSPGEITKTIAVTIVGDNTVEDDEAFSVDLDSPSNATLLDAQGIGTIVNDDSDSGGNGNGRDKGGKKGASEQMPIAVVDPHWYFSDIDASAETNLSPNDQASSKAANSEISTNVVASYVPDGFYSSQQIDGLLGKVHRNPTGNHLAENNLELSFKPSSLVNDSSTMEVQDRLFAKFQSVDASKSAVDSGASETSFDELFKNWQAEDFLRI